MSGLFQRSSLLNSPSFEALHFPTFEWQVVKAKQNFRRCEENLTAPAFPSIQEFHPDDGTCTIMELPNELLLRILQNVEFTRRNWYSIHCVNKRFNSLMKDNNLGYHTAQVQFTPYTKLVEHVLRAKQHKRNVNNALLSTVHDMYKPDEKIIRSLQQHSGHSSYVCMTLIAFLKMIISEIPRATGTRTRADMVDPVERHRIVLFRVRMVRSYLTPEALILMRYTLETMRQALAKEATGLARSGWLTQTRALDFSYYTFFEDCFLRHHVALAWDTSIHDNADVSDQLEKVEVYAKMFERQEEFLGRDLIDYDDDVCWAAMMVIHHEWGHALGQDLTRYQRNLIQQQAIPYRTDADEVGEEGEEEDKDEDEDEEEEEDGPQFLTFDTDEEGILHIGNLNLGDNNSSSNSDHLPDGWPHLLRMNKVDEVHEHLMLLTRTKYGERELMEKALDNLEMVKIQDKVRKGVKKIWSMSLEECMSAITREVEGSDLRLWLTPGMQ